WFVDLEHPPARDLPRVALSQTIADRADGKTLPRELVVRRRYIIRAQRPVDRAVGMVLQHLEDRRSGRPELLAIRDAHQLQEGLIGKPDDRIPCPALRV